MVKHKHQWVTVGSRWEDGKRVEVKKRCRDPTCQLEKTVKVNGWGG